MTDVHSPQQRHKNMAAVKNKDTKAELLVAAELQKLQIKFEKQLKISKAKVDFYLPEYNTAVLVHGCFWHGHDCHLFKVPATRTDFWLTKIKSNQARDQQHTNAMKQDKIRILIIWECAVRGRQKLAQDALCERIEEFLLSQQIAAQINSNGFDVHWNKQTKSTD
ncbi:very short patch repair endonuclease [Planctobacterium marinum]|uniref:Very short patch repair endonuclease n=1 Tax=Planctobacterium marinum TaxID=1631968 RepID=A0AA48KTW9_9ALTE|nr:very short patch repair endonuclease [Planctobacterium marinum]